MLGKNVQYSDILYNNIYYLKIFKMQATSSTQHTKPPVSTMSESKNNAAAGGANNDASRANLKDTPPSGSKDPTHYTSSEDTPPPLQSSFSSISTAKIDKPQLQTAVQAKQHVLDNIKAKFAFKQSLQELAKKSPELMLPYINSILDNVNETGIYAASEELFHSSQPQRHEQLRQEIEAKAKNLNIFEDKRNIPAEQLKQILTNNPNLKTLICSPASSESFEDIKNYLTSNSSLEVLQIYGNNFSAGQIEELKNVALAKGFGADNQTSSVLQLSKPIIAKKPIQELGNWQDIYHSQLENKPVETIVIKRTDTELVNHAMHAFNQYKFSLSKEQEEAFNALNSDPNAEHGSKLPNAQTIHYGFQPEDSTYIEYLSASIMKNTCSKFLDQSVIDKLVENNIAKFIDMQLGQKIPEQDIKDMVTQQLKDGANKLLSDLLNNGQMPKIAIDVARHQLKIEGKL